MYTKDVQVYKSLNALKQFVFIPKMLSKLSSFTDIHKQTSIIVMHDAFLDNMQNITEEFVCGYYNNNL